MGFLLLEYHKYFQEYSSLHKHHIITKIDYHGRRTKCVWEDPLFVVGYICRDLRAFGRTKLSIDFPWEDQILRTGP